MEIDKKEKNILNQLDLILKEKLISKLLSSAVSQAEEELIKNKFTSITKIIPLNIFSNQLPGNICLCRLYILQANTKAKIEKHPNSIQRVISYKGSGNIKVFLHEKWTDNYLNSTDENFSSRWLTVKEDTWHQPITYEENWASITFHTASENEIIDLYKP